MAQHLTNEIIQSELQAFARRPEQPSEAVFDAVVGDAFATSTGLGDIGWDPPDVTPQPSSQLLATVSWCCDDDLPHAGLTCVNA